MRNVLGTTYDELIRVVRYARQRWRLKVALRGTVLVLAFGFLAFALSVWGMDRFHYSSGAVLLFRIFTYAALVGLVVRFLVLPLSRRVSDEDVALYIEEHEPSLQAAIVSAIEFGPEAEEPRVQGDLERVSGAGAPSPPVSAPLVRRLVETAIAGCQEIDYGHKIEQKNLKRFSGFLAGVAAAGMAAVLLSPAFLQHGALLLFVPWNNFAAANPYSIEVSPGNLSVPRGSDQEVSARLVGFDAERVEIGVKAAEGSAWELQPMSLEEDAEHVFILLNLQEASDYYVEAGGVRSELFRIDVTDVPYVERLDLEYRFPQYTGLSPEVVEDGGDIAAVKGTQVLVRVIPTIPVPAGRLVLDGEDGLELESAQDGTWSAVVEVETPSFYKIQLQGPDGAFHAASPEYIIEVLEDQPPVLRFARPGRDVRAHKIEEVFTGVEAEDDYGLSSVELVYSVNGGDEETLYLYGRPRGSVGGKKKLSAGYTFFLEEYDLQDGDLVSYFARARDGRRPAGRQTTTTDIYFIEVRPFSRDYRQQQQGGMGGGGGGLDNTLSLRQREIIAATFKLVRDGEEYSRKEYRENLATLALLQERLREQAQTLVRRMENRAPLLGDSDFRKIIDFLNQAAEEMVPAEESLSAAKPKEALPPEQRSLKFLQRAEAVFRDVRVSFQAGGGSGGESQRLAEDLADLFELELDKLRNQYEMVDRGQRQEVENQIDEALRRLKELARRQQQENERARRRAANMQRGQGGGGSQREIMDEAEKMARRLERLAREQSRPDLQDAARRLQQAADAMKRSMTNPSSRGLAEQAQALDRLEDARRLLEKNREFQLNRDMEEAMNRAERLGQMQQKISSQVSQLGGSGGSQEQDQMQRLLERKDQLGREVQDLETDLDRMARESRGEHKEASRELQQAADSIRDNQLKEKIRYSKGVVRGRSPDYAQSFEEEIGSDIDELKERVSKAGASLGQSDEGKMAGSLEQTRDLVQGLESLEARLREQRQAGRQEGGEQRGQESQGQESQGQESQGQESQGQESQGQEGQSGRGQQGQRLARGQGQEPGETGQSGQSQGGELGGSQNSGPPRGLTSQLGPSSGGGTQRGIYSLEDLRQLDREFGQRLREGRQLRDDLRAQGLEVGDLNDVLRQMSRFDIRGLNNDPLALDRLREGVIEGLRQFEYRLWRELEGEGAEKLYLSGADEVPVGYRELVEEYFKALSAADK